MSNVICGFLDENINLACSEENLKEFAEQRAVLINWDSINHASKDISNENHTATFALKDGEKGVHIIGHAGGDSISDLFTANVSDTGANEFQHQLDFIFAAKSDKSEQYKENLAKGKFVGAVKVGENIFILGINHGLFLEEGTVFDRRENNGEYLVSILNKENRQENKTPLIYKPSGAGDAIADFFADFEA